MFYTCYKCTVYMSFVHHVDRIIWIRIIIQDKIYQHIKSDGIQMLEFFLNDC